MRPLSVAAKKIYLSLGISLSLIMFLSSGCSRDAGYTPIDFSNTIKTEKSKSLDDKEHTLKVAVSAMVSPKETFSTYRDLIDYIGDHLNYKIQLIQRKTYGDINELFLKQQIDLAFICSGPYAVGKEKYGFEALATPVIREKPFYQSYLIVNKNSSIEKIEDLRNGVFAMTDPASNTGAMVPLYWLAKMGEKPETFFKNVTYTYSHDNSILAVARSLVDGAAVDGIIWEYYNARNPLNTSQTRVIKKSIPFGSPPFVASKYLASEIKEKARDLLLNMHQDPKGRPILKELMIDRFVSPKDTWYQPVREIKKQLNVANRSSDVVQRF
ncbi:MAG: phosphate/phosphite/phosphonate ABC transporter substrate-binding protein [Deltaproteobacteria bacterium]|nr:phosphate/phosphite/phosphonate ABC transporter substrate-binding protein [Deltaproteobacteria bacterium]MBW2226368.1 phosphate/phosphite/phosphonate ABC transporter substrate-binding protein [Deltaproteobacteria bacterium]MBW2326341.1 phosphate/phosphite/phosphonate ABC transporter substrate-binding protein [Deltaproteobacteria bacterium]